MNTKFTVMFIKPDAINDGLVDQILSDFIKAGLVPVLGKKLNLNLDQASMVYRDHMDNQNYEFAIKSLVEEGGCKTSLFFVLKREKGDALLTAQEIKGRSDINGVRAKYRRYLWTELKEKGVVGEELKNMLSRNRVHVPDSNTHVCEIINVLLDNDELKKIQEADIDLIDFIEGCKQNTIEYEAGHGNKERL